MINWGNGMIEAAKNAVPLHVGSVNSSARGATAPTLLTTVRRDLSGEEISNMYDAVMERHVHGGGHR